MDLNDIALKRVNKNKTLRRAQQRPGKAALMNLRTKTFRDSNITDLIKTISRMSHSKCHASSKVQVNHVM